MRKITGILLLSLAWLASFGQVPADVVQMNATPDTGTNMGTVSWRYANLTAVQRFFIPKYADKTAFQAVKGKDSVSIYWNTTINRVIVSKIGGGEDTLSTSASALYTNGYGLLMTGNQFKVDTSLIGTKSWVNDSFLHKTGNETKTGNFEIIGDFFATHIAANAMYTYGNNSAFKMALNPVGSTQITIAYQEALGRGLRIYDPNNPNNTGIGNTDYKRVLVEGDADEMGKWSGVALNNTVTNPQYFIATDGIQANASLISNSDVVTALQVAHRNGSDAYGTWNINTTGSSEKWNDQVYNSSPISTAPSYVLAFDAGAWKPIDATGLTQFIGSSSGGETLQSVISRGNSTVSQLKIGAGGSFSTAVNTTAGILFDTQVSNGTGLEFVASNSAYGYGNRLLSVDNGAGAALFKIQGRTNSGTFLDQLVINSSTGNVLIGKTTQTNLTYKLDIDGKIRANEIVVNSTGADFVFDQKYKLRSLPSLERYILANKHLPEIPSAATMQKEGMAVSELQTKLLQKVEELTLYIIELNKKSEAQEKRIKELEIRK